MDIISLGNAGFLVSDGSMGIVIDPYCAVPGWNSFLKRLANKRIVAIVITHGHWDHFEPREVVALAQDRNALVVCPHQVSHRLFNLNLNPELNAELEPTSADRIVRSIGVDLTISAYRTEHGSEHNSYLLEWRGFRLFHDGDNENTRLLDWDSLCGLDGLMLCPWQGSGWVEFIEHIRPRHWFLMHLDSSELEAHDRELFLPELCDHIPQTPIALRPGQTYEIYKV
ncbi:MBL fold metallo-hydrolase [bacterium]|nr:MBL fold metallo-hydrolase [bacterium]